jgi:hypothetical protein
MSWRDRMKGLREGQRKAREQYHSPPRKHLEERRRIEHESNELARKFREKK